jgi:hypothetical protein
MASYSCSVVFAMAVPVEDVFDILHSLTSLHHKKTKYSVIDVKQVMKV